MSFRQEILDGRRVLGCWMFGSNAIFMELAARTGIDFILIDMEHGEVALHDIPTLLRAGQGRDMAVLVRPPSHDAGTLTKLVDFGVDGIVVPKVNTAEEAAGIAAACRYPPHGNRGLATGSIRASGYGIDGAYRDKAAASVLVAVQIETRDAVTNMAAIAVESEIDMLFVGPNDLSASLGHPGQTEEAATEVAQVVADLRALGKPIGTIPFPGHDRAALHASGVSLVVAGSDLAAMRLYLKGFKEG